MLREGGGGKTGFNENATNDLPANFCIKNVPAEQPLRVSPLRAWPERSEGTRVVIDIIAS
jgi:hypothetical protein